MEALASSNKQSKIDQKLQPFMITQNHTPVELRVWKTQLDEYLNSRESDITSQRAYFTKCVNLDLLAAINNRVDNDVAMYSASGLIARLEKEFLIMLGERHPTQDPHGTQNTKALGETSGWVIEEKDW